MLFYSIGRIDKIRTEIKKYETRKCELTITLIKIRGLMRIYGLKSGNFNFNKCTQLKTSIALISMAKKSIQVYVSSMAVCADEH